MIRKLLVLLLTTVALVVGVSSSAAAHAQLESTDPANGAVVGRSPDRVMVRFDEPVEISLGSLRVYDAEARRVDNGHPRHAQDDDRVVEVPLRALGEGVYVVTWRLISADSHPVHGGTTFTVGATSVDSAGLVDRLLTADRGSAAVATVADVARVLLFAGIILFLGAIAFLMMIDVSENVSRHITRLASIGVLAALVASVIGVLLQGPYASALGVSHVVDIDLVRETLSTRFGWSTGLRIITLCVLAALLRPRRFHIGSRWWRFTIAALGIGVVMTVTAAGHGASGRYAPLGSILDVIHVLVVAVWIGGLPSLLAVILCEPSTENRDAITRKFSRLALICVVVIAATGAVQGWRQLGSLGALAHTDYGRLLIIKVGVFTGIVAIAGVTRRLLRRSNVASNKLRANVCTEIALGFIVIVITSLLVNSSPGFTADTKPFSAEVTAGNVLVDIVIDPARSGSDAVHLYVLTDGGALADVAEVTMSMSLPRHDVGPIDIPLQDAGRGHYLNSGFTIPIRGRWQGLVSVRTSDVDVSSATFNVPIK